MATAGDAQAIIATTANSSKLLQHDVSSKTALGRFRWKDIVPILRRQRVHRCANSGQLEQSGSPYYEYDIDSKRARVYSPSQYPGSGHTMPEAFICERYARPSAATAARCRGARRRSRRGPDQGAAASATRGSTAQRSTTCLSAAPIRPARTTATSRAWRCCSRACRATCPA